MFEAKPFPWYPMDHFLLLYAEWGHAYIDKLSIAWKARTHYSPKGAFLEHYRRSSSALALAMAVCTAGEMVPVESMIVPSTSRAIRAGRTTRSVTTSPG